LLLEALLIGRGDGVEPLLNRRLFRRDDHHDFAALAQHGSALRITPLPRRIEHRQSIRKPRRDLAREKLSPGCFTDAQPAGATAEQQIDGQHRPQRRAAVECLAIT